jgi:hypothetical protein
MSEAFEQRLLKAYFRKFGKNADIPQQEIEYKKFNGKDYAILSNCNGVLAVYRLLVDDKVKLEKNVCPYRKSIKNYPGLHNHTEEDITGMSAEARERRSEAYKKLEEYRAKKEEFEVKEIA